jgi:hypothetical protein
MNALKPKTQRAKAIDGEQRRIDYLSHAPGTQSVIYVSEIGGLTKTDAGVKPMTVSHILVGNPPKLGAAEVGFSRQDEFGDLGPVDNSP